MCIASRILLVVLFAVTLFPRAAESQTGADDPVALAIADELETLLNPEVTSIRGARIALRDPIQEFYAQRGFRAAWNNPHNAEQLRKALADSYDDGLDPIDYHVPLLDKLSQQVAQPGVSAKLRAEYDVLLTEALLRLGYHLSFGKVDPETFDAQWNYGRTLGRIDVAREVEQALATEDIYERVQALKPTHKMYIEGKRELARYRMVAASGHWLTIPSGPTLKPGMSDVRIPAIRARLIASGDLDSGASSDALEYDPQLDVAVRSFQQRMGLADDAVLGPTTLAELNTPIAERIQQLRVNLDRGRVLLQDLPDEFVVVNIAGFTAYFVRGQEIVWNARVQVGQKYRRTPIFRSEINYIVLNPTWTVPPGIIEKDILPAAQKDPESITRKKLRVLDASGREVAPDSVDWSRYRGGHIPYTLRQDPGPSNALGRVKLMFPNPHFVYLHDTPSQALFERSERTFSSGCVRVERALELTELVLNDQERWNKESIARVVEAGQVSNVTLKKKIPVLLAYWTAWVDPKGRMNFRRDVYGQDEQWAKALDEEFKIRTKPLFAAPTSQTIEQSP